VAPPDPAINRNAAVPGLQVRKTHAMPSFALIQAKGAEQ
jgi:hypothetical protein